MSRKWHDNGFWKDENICRICEYTSTWKWNENDYTKWHHLLEDHSFNLISDDGTFMDIFPPFVFTYYRRVIR